MNTKTSLFDRKELYRMECTSTGRSYKTTMIPKRLRRKVIFDNMHLMEGMSFTTTHSFPQMLSYNGNIDFDLVAYSEKKDHSGKGEALHFFIDDYRFRDQLWCNLEYAIYNISHFDYIFTPDFSLWRNLPTEYYNQRIFSEQDSLGFTCNLGVLMSSLHIVSEDFRLFPIAWKVYHQIA